MAAITNIIITLNLLISILGNAHEKTQMSVRENDLFLMLGLVTEYESLMFWRRIDGTSTVIVSCQRAQDTESTEEWAGIVVAMEAAVKEEVGVGEKGHSDTEGNEETQEEMEGRLEGKMQKGNY